MKKKKKPIPANTPWTEFELCTHWNINGREERVPEGYEIWRNNIYTVHREHGEAEGIGEIIWLSIKRNDKQPIHDWRDLQRLKNIFSGTEREAVELYPAESRMVDTSNQYHLWIMPPGYKFPFGYAERLVMDHTADAQTLAPRAKQRPFAPGQRPPDAISGQEFEAKWRENQAFGLQRMVHKRRV